jgi:hypothetical protein
MRGRGLAGKRVKCMATTRVDEDGFGGEVSDDDDDDGS